MSEFFDMKQLRERWQRERSRLAGASLGPGWLLLRALGNSQVVRLSSAFPFVGYLIIFNEKVTEWIQLSRRYVDLPDLSNQAGNHILDLKLYFIYFGLLCLGIGSIIYQMFCPRIIKRYSDAIDYIEREQSMLTNNDYQQISFWLDTPITTTLLPIENEKKIELLRNFYNRLNFHKPLSASFALAFMIVGLGFLAIPAISSFIAIYNSLVRTLLSANGAA